MCLVGDAATALQVSASDDPLQLRTMPMAVMLFIAHL